jgi:hypothetical protein
VTEKDFAFWCGRLSETLRGVLYADTLPQEVAARQVAEQSLLEYDAELRASRVRDAKGDAA